MDDLKESRGYWKLKEEALDHTLWGTRFGKCYGPIVRPDSRKNDITNALPYLVRYFGINEHNPVKLPVSFH
jgi:hypothetical protein